MNLDESVSAFTHEDFDRLGFHDCYVRGIRWGGEQFSFSVELDYIVKWIEPADDGFFKFWIRPAVLRFDLVDDVVMDFDGTGLMPECQIDGLRRTASRATPNGSTQWHWEFELIIPDGSISLWATGFELSLNGPPVLSASQHL